MCQVKSGAEKKEKGETTGFKEVLGVEVEEGNKEFSDLFPNTTSISEPIQR
jgi:hypothetical protein